TATSRAARPGGARLCGAPLAAPFRAPLPRLLWVLAARLRHRPPRRTRRRTVDPGQSQRHRRRRSAGLSVDPHVLALVSSRDRRDPHGLPPEAAAAVKSRLVLMS